MKIEYVDTDMVQNKEFKKPYDSIIANGYDRVYGVVTTNIDIDIGVVDIKELYKKNILQIYSKDICNILFGMFANDKVYFKAVFWDNNRTHIVGCIM